MQRTIPVGTQSPAPVLGSAQFCRVTHVGSAGLAVEAALWLTCPSSHPASFPSLLQVLMPRELPNQPVELEFVSEAPFQEMHSGGKPEPWPMSPPPHPQSRRPGQSSLPYVPGPTTSLTPSDPLHRRTHPQFLPAQGARFIFQAPPSSPEMHFNSSLHTSLRGPHCLRQTIS